MFSNSLLRHCLAEIPSVRSQQGPTTFDLDSFDKELLVKQPEVPQLSIHIFERIGSSCVPSINFYEVESRKEIVLPAAIKEDKFEEEPLLPVRRRVTQSTHFEGLDEDEAGELHIDKQRNVCDELQLPSRKVQKIEFDVDDESQESESAPASMLQSPKAARPTPQEPNFNDLAHMLSGLRDQSEPQNLSLKKLRRKSKYDAKTTEWIEQKICQLKPVPLDTKFKPQRRIERTLRDVVTMISLWRFLYEGGQKEANISLQDAATRIGVSKKSLDDYILIVRRGVQLGYDFYENRGTKIGHLRSFIKIHMQ